jgi:hypothetical protein
MTSPQNAIYVTNLPSGTTKDSLSPFFSRFGTIRQIVIHPPKHSSVSAVILFATEESMQTAIQKANYQVFSMFPIQVKRAFVQRSFTPRSRLAIRGIPTSVRERDIHAAFSVYGEIDSIQISRTLKGRSRGIALIQFTTDEEASTAAAAGFEHFAEIRISRAPVWSKGVQLAPLNEFSVDVCGPSELRTPASLRVLFSAYSPFEIVESALIFGTPEIAARCASEFEHDSVVVFTFAHPAVVDATNQVIRGRAAVVRGYCEDDFGVVRAIFPTALAFMCAERDGHPSMIAYFASAAERDRAVADSHGKRPGLSQLPLIVMPFIRQDVSKGEVVIVYEPSLSLTEAAVRERFPDAFAVTVCPTLNCDCYGFALYAEHQAPAGAWVVSCRNLLMTAMAVTSVQRRIVVVRDVTDEEDIAEQLIGAKLARAGSTVVGQFSAHSAATAAFSALARAGHAVDIFSEEALRMVYDHLLHGDGIDDGKRTILVKDLSLTIGNHEVRQLFARFGEIEFSVVLHESLTRYHSGRHAIVTFAAEDSCEKALAGTFEAPYETLEVEKVSSS